MMSMKGDGKPSPSSRIARCRWKTSPSTPIRSRRSSASTARKELVRPRIVDTARAADSRHEEDGAKKMRAIAEEACALVKKYKGAAIRGSTATAWCARVDRAHHRLAPCRGAREIKHLFDPKGLLNRKDRAASKQDDRTLFRFKPGYAPERLDTVLD